MKILTPNIKETYLAFVSSSSYFCSLYFAESLTIEIFQDQNGWIDFNEFIIATHCSATSSPADKLHWVFQMYDKDQSQTIQVPGAGVAEVIMLPFQLGEMVELFGTLYLNEGLEMDAAVERANAIFSALDINNDGDVTEEEFVRGCMEVRRCW